MTRIEAKQYELDAKVVFMLDSQQVQIQAFNDIQNEFFSFFGGREEHTNTYLLNL
jgi:hypothetical protein